MVSVSREIYGDLRSHIPSGLKALKSKSSNWLPIFICQQSCSRAHIFDIESALWHVFRRKHLLRFCFDESSLDDCQWDSKLFDDVLKLPNFLFRVTISHVRNDRLIKGKKRVHFNIFWRWKFQRSILLVSFNLSCRSTEYFQYCFEYPLRESTLQSSSSLEIYFRASISMQISVSINSPQWWNRNGKFHWKTSYANYGGSVLKLWATKWSLSKEREYSFNLVRVMTIKDIWTKMVVYWSWYKRHQKGPSKKIEESIKIHLSLRYISLDVKNMVRMPTRDQVFANVEWPDRNSHRKDTVYLRFHSNVQLSDSLSRSPESESIWEIWTREPGDQ